LPPALKDAEVEGATDWLTIFPDGRVFLDPDVSVTKDQYQQMWQGYMCSNCYEPLDPPFPEVCPLPGCNFHVRDEQRRMMTERFGGEKWFGPSEGLLDRLQAGSEPTGKTKTGIWVPGDAA